MLLITTHIAMRVIWLDPKNEINNREMKKKNCSFFGASQMTLVEGENFFLPTNEIYIGLRT